MKNKNKKELLSFIKNGINSKYSKLIYKYLNNKYFEEFILNEISNIDLNYHFYTQNSFGM